MKATEKIWRNGEFIAWDDAKIHVLSHVVSYGSSVFEGIRCYETASGPAVFRLREHVRRMVDSAKIYRMDTFQYTREQLEDAILELVAVNHLKSCYIRPIVLRGFGEMGVNGTKNPVDIYLACWEWGKYLGDSALADGVDVCVSSWNRIAPNTLPSLAKAGANYMNSQLMKMEAVANGYSEHFVNFVQKAREACPDKVICAGNVVTGEMVEELILAGADVVKVGIGPGSVCTTRVKTGVGYPQLSAVIECADAAHGLSGQIVSDGGCAVPGDVAKAFGGGADFVMLGGMLAGHDECEGTVVEENGEKFMLFYGMSSESAMKRHVGGVAEYRAAEGKTVKLPLRGPVENAVRDILGGLRSACTYVGASRLKELTKRTTFIRVAEQENQVFTQL